MASNDDPSDQKRLFPADETDAAPQTTEDNFSLAGESSGAGPGPDPAESDMASEEERLRNGDISFRPVSLPEATPVPQKRRSGTGTTALMIISAIVVVFLLTYVVQTFYSPPVVSGPDQEDVIPGDEGDAGPDAAVRDTTNLSPITEEAASESAAMFQAHTDLQAQYQKAESQITELEAELQKLRNGSADTATSADADRLARLEAENRELKTAADTAVSRAEQLVERAREQVAEERGRTSATVADAEQAREQVQAVSIERDLLTSERDELRKQIEQLEADTGRQTAEYDRLAASTTTRLEGESEAVRQLISRHALERERLSGAIHEKDAEIERLKTLIARLSVSEEVSAPPKSTASGSGTTPARSPAGGVDTPPQILTRREPVYPVTARRLKVEGTVLLNVLVGANGSVREVKVLEAEGGKLLSPSAVEAVRQWTFSPATRGGTAVDCWHKIPIRFAL